MVKTVSNRCGETFQCSIRIFQSEDLPQVKVVLKNAAYSNVFPGVLLTICHPVFGSCMIASIAAVAIFTSSIFYVTTFILVILMLVLVIHSLIATFIVYGPPLQDLNEIITIYDGARGGGFWVAEVLSVDSHVARIVGTIAIVNKEDVLSMNSNSQRNSKQQLKELQNNACVTGNERKTISYNKTAQLRRMAVLQSFRGMGIADDLIKFAIEFCCFERYERIFLITTAVHRAARRLYEYNGFRCISYKPYFYFANIVKIWTYEYEYVIQYD